MFAVQPSDILSSLRLHGVAAVSPGAVTALLRQLKGEADPAASLRALASALARAAADAPGGASGGGVLDEAAVAAVVAEITRGEDDTRAEALSLVSCDAWPRYAWESARRAYVCLGRSFALHGGASARVALYAERLAQAGARLSRHPTFAPPVAGSLRREHVSLTSVDGLCAGAPAARGGGEPVTLLGMLTQPEEGLWCLDDGAKSVALALAGADRGPGYFTEMCVVLVAGVYDADATMAEGPTPAAGARAVPLVDGRLPGVLRVATISHPPAEARAATLHAMGVVDAFGVIKSPAEFDRAAKLEAAAAAAAAAALDGGGALGVGGGGDARDAPFLFLSDVHLDKPRVLRALAALLRGLADARNVPALVVLAGNFCSTPFGQAEGDRDRARARFDALAAVLAAVPELAAEGCVVAVVPGPNDPGTCGALPRPPIPAYFASRLTAGAAAGLPAVALMSNPCRIRYFTQEILFARADTTSRLRKRAILSPVPHDADHAVHTLHTLVRQAHLAPLPLSVQPVYWEHDYALRLLPLPDVLVLAEARDPVALEDSGLKMLCPGSFARETHFLYYSPALRTGDTHCRVEEAAPAPAPRATPATPRAL